MEKKGEKRLRNFYLLGKISRKKQKKIPTGKKAKHKSVRIRNEKGVGIY